MSNSEAEIPITRIVDLLKQDQYKYGVFNGTATLDDFKLDLLYFYRDKGIYDKIVDWGTIWEVKGFKLPDNEAVVDDYLLLRSIMAKNCHIDYRLLEGKLNFEEVAFAMRRNHELLANITRKITEYGRDGDLTKWEADERFTCDEAPKSSDPPHTIDAKKMKGLYTVVASAAALGLLQSVGAWIARNWRKKGKVEAMEKDFDAEITQTTTTTTTTTKKGADGMKW